MPPKTKKPRKKTALQLAREAQKALNEAFQETIVQTQASFESYKATSGSSPGPLLSPFSTPIRDIVKPIPSSSPVQYTNDDSGGSKKTNKAEVDKSLEISDEATARTSSLDEDLEEIMGGGLQLRSDIDQTTRKREISSDRETASKKQRTLSSSNSIVTEVMNRNTTASSTEGLGDIDFEGGSEIPIKTELASKNALATTNPGVLSINEANVEQDVADVLENHPDFPSEPQELPIQKVQRPRRARSASTIIRRPTTRSRAASTLQPSSESKTAQSPNNSPSLKKKLSPKSRLTISDNSKRPAENILVEESDDDNTGGNSTKGLIDDEALEEESKEGLEDEDDEEDEEEDEEDEEENEEDEEEDEEDEEGDEEESEDETQEEINDEVENNMPFEDDFNSDEHDNNPFGSSIDSDSETHDSEYEPDD